jgi:uncharacterized RDD family membrane protein YckC
MAESYQNPDFNNQNFQNYYPAPPIQELRVGFGKRFGAWILDLFIVMLLAGIFSYIIPIRETKMWNDVESKMEAEMKKQEEAAGREFTDEEKELSTMIGEGTALVMLFFFPTRLLYSIVELFSGSTFGKHMLGITIANSNGQAPSMALKAARWFISYSAVILIVLGIVTQIDLISTVGNILGLLTFVGCFFALGEQKQALHDKIAKTAVFHKEDIANMQVLPVATPAV